MWQRVHETNPDVHRKSYIRLEGPVDFVCDRSTWLEVAGTIAVAVVVAVVVVVVVVVVVMLVILVVVVV